MNPIGVVEAYTTKISCFTENLEKLNGCKKIN